jgi:hypothetical protein
MASLDLEADKYEFRIVCYEEGIPAEPPPGDGWVAKAFETTQSTTPDSDLNRCAWILWVRPASSNGSQL